MNVLRSTRGLIAALSLPLLFVAACGDSGSSTGSNTGSITITLGGQTLVLTQGESGTVTVNVVRNDFDGALTVSAQGLPTGVTAPNVTIGASETQGTLTFTAGGSAAAGQSNVTVSVAGQGIATRTASLALTVNAGTEPTFTLAATSTAVTVQAGASTTTTLSADRVANFAGNVALSATAPAGITTSFSQQTLTTTTTSSILTITADGSVAAGAYTVTVNAVSGAITRTQAITVTVTSNDGGGGGGGGAGNVTWNFCGAVAGVPAWVAAQDGNGAWQAVNGANGVFSFQINSGRGGIAYAVQTATGGWDTRIFFGTTAELQAVGTSRCFGSTGAGKTVTGTLTGAGLTDLTLATLGQSQANIAGGAMTFSNVIEGNVDLIVGNSTLGGGAFLPARLFIQRGLNIANGGSVGTINMANGVVPATATMTINNLGAEVAVIGPASYVTANNTRGVLYALAGLPVASASQTWYGFPAGSQVAGDMHVINVIALPSLLDNSQTRQVTLVSAAVANRTVTLGPALAAPTVTVTSTAPYVRLNAAHNVQASYNGYFLANYQQGTGAASRAMTVEATAGYLDGAATFNGQIPDLTPAGYVADYGLKTAVATTWTLTATGWTTGNFIGANPWTDGATYLSGTRMGTITP